MSDWRVLDVSPSGVITYFRGDGKGGCDIRHSQECQDIVDDNKRLQTHNDGFSKSRDLKRIASIPVNVYAQWGMELGYDLNALSVDHRNAVIRRKLRDPDWAHLRTSGGSV